MKISKNLNTNGMASASLNSVDSTPPSGGISNVSKADNSPINMNTPEPKPRAYRADQLIDTMSDDSYSLTVEAPRMTKMKG
jgi:hypothetical protein